MAKGDPPWWSEALRLKDAMPLATLAQHLGVSVPTLVTAFKDRRVARRVRLVDAAPPVASAPPPAPPPASGPRTGSKDGRLAAVAHLLGQVPDGEIARRAGVSIRTVASYRARHGIPGFDGPRRRPDARGRRASRVDDFKDLLGVVPDRVIAEEAGMSLGAIRNFRLKQGIDAVGRMSDAEIAQALAAWRGEAPSAPGPEPIAPTAGTPTRHAWQVRTDADTYVVVASDLGAAVAHAARLAGGQHAVAAIERLGPVLA